MRLFQIDENDMVKVNSPWIKLIPEFAALFQLEKQNIKKEYERRTLGRKLLAYIYFMHDFSSPIFSWNDEERKKESLRYTGLDIKDADREVVKLAIAKYEELQYELCRPLKTYKAALRGLEGLDKYLETINFSATDKQGKLLYTPNQFTQNIAYINKAYKELRDLKKMIEEEMSQSTGIRGTATMGDREMKMTGKADSSSDRELDLEEFSGDNSPTNFRDISTLLNHDD